MYHFASGNKSQWTDWSGCDVFSVAGYCTRQSLYFLTSTLTQRFYDSGTDLYIFTITSALLANLDGVRAALLTGAFALSGHLPPGHRPWPLLNAFFKTPLSYCTARSYGAEEFRICRHGAI